MLPISINIYKYNNKRRNKNYFSFSRLAKLNLELASSRTYRYVLALR